MNAMSFLSDEDNAKIARLALVDNVPTAALAVRFKRSKARIRAIVNSFKKERAKNNVDRSA